MNEKNASKTTNALETIEMLILVGATATLAIVVLITKYFVSLYKKVKTRWNNRKSKEITEQFASTSELN